MSYERTRYFWAAGFPDTVGAINAPRFATYAEAEADAIKAKFPPVDYRTIFIYSETVEAMSEVSITCTREIRHIRAASAGDN